MKLSKEEYHNLHSLRLVRRLIRRGAKAEAKKWPELGKVKAKIVIRHKVSGQTVLKLYRYKGKFFNFYKYDGVKTSIQKHQQK